jgi:hypothetical protein
MKSKNCEGKRIFVHDYFMKAEFARSGGERGFKGDRTAGRFLPPFSR